MTMIKAPRGTVDLLPEDTPLWQYIEQTLRQISDQFNYKEIRTPLFEHTELFQRGVGEATDIVQKEMYTFEDRGGRSITLKPEGTAPVVRAYIQNKLYGNPVQPVKLFYFGEFFRYERPQQGRMRQLNQFGVEVLGSADPALDAEVIDLAMTCYRQLGLKSLKLVINSLGDLESRQDYRRALVEHFTPYAPELCQDCQIRLRDNPMRILDCKTDKDHPAMHTAPSILDYLNEASSAYFDQVKSYLDVMGIVYEVDQNLVRGLDYYNHTAFEIMSDAEGFGAITTLTGGGRYNGLVEDLDGPPTPGIGFGMGLERLIMALKAEQSIAKMDKPLQCMVIAVGDAAQMKAVKLLHELRQANIRADKDYMGRKIKAQFKTANRLQAQFTLILGEDELSRDVVNLRNMNTGDQEEISLSSVTEVLANYLGGA